MPRRVAEPARSREAVVHLPGLQRAPFLRFLPSGRSLLIGFAVVLVAGGLYLLARDTPMFSLNRVEVEGAPPAVAAHVRAALAPLEGHSLVTLGSGDVARRLAALPDVAAATYDRDFPHTLRVFVRPEHPVAIARRGAKAWLIAASTRTMAAVPLRTHLDLPRVWLAQSGDPQVGQPITDRPGLRAVRVLALARLARFQVPVRMVRVQQGDVSLLLGSGIELRLGALSAIPLKLAIATKILPDLRRHGGYSYLDVSVPERPVAGTSLNSQPKP